MFKKLVLLFLTVFAISIIALQAPAFADEQASEASSVVETVTPMPEVEDKAGAVNKASSEETVEEVVEEQVEVVEEPVQDSKDDLVESNAVIAEDIAVEETASDDEATSVTDVDGQAESALAVDDLEESELKNVDIPESTLAETPEDETAENQVVAAKSETMQVQEIIVDKYTIEGEPIKACQIDMNQHCRQVKPGNNREIMCLLAHEDKLLDGCREGILEAAIALELGVDSLDYAYKACAKERAGICGNVNAGNGELAYCIRTNIHNLSAQCKTALKDTGFWNAVVQPAAGN